MQAAESILRWKVFDYGNAARVGANYNVVYRTVSAHDSQDPLPIWTIAHRPLRYLKLGFAILQRITK